MFTQEYIKHCAAYTREVAPVVSSNLRECVVRDCSALILAYAMPTKKEYAAIVFIDDDDSTENPAIGDWALSLDDNYDIRAFNWSMPEKYYDDEGRNRGVVISIEELDDQPTLANRLNEYISDTVPDETPYQTLSFIRALHAWRHVEAAKVTPATALQRICNLRAIHN